MEEYADERWVCLFRMTEKVVFALVDMLRSQIEWQDTKYHLTLPVVVRVAYTLFKLTHGASLLVCSWSQHCLFNATRCGPWHKQRLIERD